MTTWSTNALGGALIVLATTIASADELLLQARLAEDEHRFDDARAALLQAVDRNPRNAEAWLGLASVALVQGDALTGQHACRRVAALADPIAGLACRGAVALATGQHDAAYRPLARLLNGGPYSGRADRFTTWAHGVLADLAAAMGKDGQADREYQRAIEGGAPPRVKARYLDHLLATQRPVEVLALADTRSDLQMLRRLIALAQLGRLSEALFEVALLDAAFRADMRANDYVHGREMARFYLDVMPRPALAHLAAERNFEIQREPEDRALWLRAFQSTEHARVREI